MKQNYQSTIFKLKNKVNILCLFFILAAGSVEVSYSQNSYTFTPAGATGSLGPTQTQINLAYGSTNLVGTNSVTIITATPGIQTWTVPTTMGYRIEARGAQGYGSFGGKGAVMAGDFTLTAGTVLKILVGQKAETPVNTAATHQYGGGGGSFVTNLSNVPYVVAGGGGGSYATSFGTNSDGTVTTTGNTGASATDIGAGGTGGNGGAGAGSADGGGGFITNGVGFSAPGIAFLNGGTGGTYLGYGLGGFGGGAGTSSYDDTRGGGGGGYSGGGGAHTSGVGVPQAGGGGSYNNGINQTNVSGGNLGQGTVIISELCNIRIFGSGSNSVAPSICSGNSLSLTTNAVSNFTWSNGNTTNTMIVVSPTSSQSYSIIGTSSLACIASGAINVIVNSVAPVLTITNTPNNICLGKTATLTAGGAVTYTWTGGPGGIINGQTFTPTATSNYTVVGQNGCGTTTSVTTITIAPLAVTAASNPTLVCAGSPATLTAGSAVTGYTWYPVAIPGMSIVVAPTVNTVYTVTASDGTCSGVTTLTLNTKPNPTLSIAASNGTVCEGAVVTLTASGALSYTWNAPASNSPNISDNPTLPTLYVVSGMNSVNCVATANQIIFTKPSPTVAISASKTNVCSGDPVTLTASGATTYNWTNGPGTAGNVVNPTSNTTYTVTGSANNCSNTKMITISVLTASVAVSVSTPSICNGASTNLHASGATTYTWAGIPSVLGNASVSPSVTTIYTVNATTSGSGLNCPSSTSIAVTVFDNPTVTISSTKTLVCKADAPLVLTAGGATTYTWSTATVSTSINVHPQSTITYTITGVDANGCMNTASKTIQVNVCSGIAELNNTDKKISIYPNPSNGEFVVSADSEMNLKLFNELGQEIKTIKLSEQNDYKVSVSNLANGVYFIVGQDTNKVTQKIIVAK